MKLPLDPAQWGSMIDLLSMHMPNSPEALGMIAYLRTQPPEAVMAHLTEAARVIPPEQMQQTANEQLQKLQVGDAERAALISSAMDIFNFLRQSQACQAQPTSQPSQ